LWGHVYGPTAQGYDEHKYRPGSYHGVLRAALKSSEVYSCVLVRACGPRAPHLTSAALASSWVLIVSRQPYFVSHRACVIKLAEFLQLAAEDTPNKATV
jgi:hypothetical protein